MLHKEVFKNEEATKLLEYFVAYKKLMSKVEYVKCISALNSEVHLTPLPEHSSLTPTVDNQPPTVSPATFDR